MKRNIVSTAIQDIAGPSHRYKNERGEISLLHPCRTTMGSYEIFCIEGDLFEDIERYDTLEEAEERISDLLKEPV